MNLSVNGEEVSLEMPCTINDLLDRRSLGTTACAVEVNRQLVPKKRHFGHMLREGDQVEIVTLVGGG